MRKIAIFGHGGLGREMLTIIDAINIKKPIWDFIGFFDDENKIGTINGYPYLGGINELNNYSDKLHLVIGIGNPKTKKNIITRLENKFIQYPILIHPTAIIGNPQFISIDSGTVIAANCVITTNVKIGKHVLLNLCSTVGHDTEIADYCSFMPTVNISGEVIIYECVYVGTGVQIINQLQIGARSIIGAGSVVVKSLPDDCTAVGIPAKIIKMNK